MSGCLLVEADFSAIEAVQVGWYSGDPDYIRLAKLGVHAYLASHVINKPADLKWTEEHLGGYFKELKESHPEPYKKAKQTVHLSNYVGGPRKMMELFPETFPTIKEATKLQNLYFELCPLLKKWQDEVIQRAARKRFLGGSDHPFRYKHHFWEVMSYRNGKWSLGPDARRAVAFYPQSTAAGIIKEAALRLTRPESPYYLGNIFYGKTPIRALVHDSILFEIPGDRVHWACQKIYDCMTLPVVQQPLPKEWKLGEFLQIGVAVKTGLNWGEYDKEHPDRNPHGMRPWKAEAGVASDTTVREGEDEDDETEAVA